MRALPDFSAEGGSGSVSRHDSNLKTALIWLAPLAGRQWAVGRREAGGGSYCPLPTADCPLVHQSSSSSSSLVTVGSSSATSSPAFRPDSTSTLALSARPVVITLLSKNFFQASFSAWRAASPSSFFSS